MKSTDLSQAPKAATKISNRNSVCNSLTRARKPRRKRQSSPSTSSSEKRTGKINYRSASSRTRSKLHNLIVNNKRIHSTSDVYCCIF